MLRFPPSWASVTWVPQWVRNVRLWRSGAMLALALGIVGLVGSSSGVHSPIQGWIVWDYATLWLWQGYLSLGCLGAGSFVTRDLLRVDLPRLEHVVVSMAVGVSTFVLLMYGGGVLGWYGPTFSVLLPLVMMLGGVRGALRFVRALRQGRVDLSPAPRAPMETLALGLGVVGFFAVYVQAATPDAIAYDASWSHLGVAEDYAREGRIVPFLTNTPKNLPHLSSILYTWAFCLPGLGHPALHWMAAQHVELLLFVWTLVGVAATVRFVLPEKNCHASWAAFFLFPGFYVYDSNFGAAADHVAAFFALPFLLVSLRAGAEFRPGLVALSGALAGALLHAKFQATYLIAPIAFWFVVRFVWLLGRAVRARRKAAEDEGARATRWLLLAPVLHVGAALLFFGPHLLKNWIFYKNPLYPLFLESFPSQPFLSGFAYDPMQEATAAVSLGERLTNALELMFTFSFRPQYTFIGNVPVFGSLFTAFLPVILLRPRLVRLVGVVLLAQGAIFVWAFVYPIDRNLQLILPWLAAGTAAAIIVAWEWGKLARIGVATLIVLQVAWGAKFMVTGGEARVASLMALMKKDMAQGTPKERYDHFRANYRLLGESLPKDAVLLLHTHHVALGINRKTHVDWAGWQYAIDYRPMETPRDLYERYKELGITHLFWNNRDFPASKQEDVLFFALSRQHAKRIAAPGFAVWEMPEEAPPPRPPFQVVSLGLHGYPDGLYPVTALSVIEEGNSWRKAAFPKPKRALGRAGKFGELVDAADAVLLASTFQMTKKRALHLNKCFRKEHQYYGGYRIPFYSVYLRRPKCEAGHSSQMLKTTVGPPKSGLSSKSKPSP